MCMCHLPGEIYRPAAAPAPIQDSEAPAQTCPNCQAPLREDFAFCPQCALRLSPTRTCSYCGRAVESRWTTCPSCGASLR